MLRIGPARSLLPEMHTTIYEDQRQPNRLQRQLLKDSPRGDLSIAATVGPVNI